MRVLVVEDEPRTAAFVSGALKEAGYETLVVSEGREALRLALALPFQVVVLDIVLPGMDGLSVLRALRANKCTTPVLLLSARGKVDERIEGLNLGADDYLPKPFALAEVVARVRVLARHREEGGPMLLKVGDLVLDRSKRIARRGNRMIILSEREYRLLEFLMRSAGRVCGRMTLLEEVWDYHFDPGTNLVDVYIGRVRRKIEMPGERRLLLSIRGIGYTLTLREACEHECPRKHQNSPDDSLNEGMKR